MSTLSKVLTEEIRKIEDTHLVEEVLQKYRLSHRFMPPVGCLNAPDSLCYFKGRYHVFLQYQPFLVEGRSKYWGHYSSLDLVQWKYEGTPLVRETIFFTRDYPKIQEQKIKVKVKQFIGKIWSLEKMTFTK